jgi:hypothetical protein
MPKYIQEGECIPEIVTMIWDLKDVLTGKT